MSIAISTGPWPVDIGSDEEAITRLQGILLQNVEGSREGEIDREYKELRDALLNNPEYADVVPRLIRVHRDLRAMWPYMKSFAEQWEPRRKHVRAELEPLFQRAEELASKASNQDPPWPGADASSRANSSDWTGMLSRSQKLATAQALLPMAQASIERLIEQLSQASHNGGPPLDETADAIANLRELHRAIGEILEAIEGGNWSEVEGEGLPAEAARYAKRAARALRDDPLPYAISGLLLGIFSACGFPTIASHLAAVALTIQKGPMGR